MYVCISNVCMYVCISNVCKALMKREILKSTREQSDRDSKRQRERAVSGQSLWVNLELTYICYYYYDRYEGEEIVEALVDVNC